MEKKRSFTQAGLSDSDEGVQVKKKPTDRGLALIQKMGFKGEKGLGKNEQGILHPIEAVGNRGRLGIGAHPSGETDDLPDKYLWTPEQEKSLIAAEEDVEWLTCEDDGKHLTREKLSRWLEYGEDTSGETFCDGDIFNAINKCRSSLDGLSDVQVMRGRSHANPFEQIGKGIFQNRAAMKMANIDARFDLIFTDSVKSANKLLYFGDICAGPGGFSEYVLWKKKWRAHGFGMTLKAENDWHLDEFITGTETFEVHYGDPGLENQEGNIYVPENLTAFNEFIESRVNEGLHFMMADGGFSVKGNENCQEVLSKRLYLCQFICALQNVRYGGHFMCKLFDCFTPFTVGLLYLMHLSFERVCIFKPNTSRPANSERYFICVGKKQCSDLIREHLFSLNQQWHDKKVEDPEIVSIVPVEVMKQSTKFYEYIYRSNNELGFRQIIFLNKMKTFALDSTHSNPNYGTLNHECLRRWRIPTEASYRQNYRDRVRNLSMGPDSYFTEMIKPWHADDFKTLTPIPLTNESFYDVAKLLSLDCGIYSYKARLLSVNDPSGHMNIRNIANEKRGLILVMNRAKVYIKDTSVSKSAFQQLHSLDSKPINLNLPARTLVTGELVYEYSDNSMRKVLALHLLDCLFLGGEDVRQKSPDERARLLSLFTESIQNTHLESKSSFTAVRCRSLYRWDEIQSLIEQMVPTLARKSHKGEIVMYHKVAKEHNIIPTGLMIVPVIDTNSYLKCVSKKTRSAYYFRKNTGQSLFEPPRNINNNVYEYFDKVPCFWPWRLDLNNSTDDSEESQADRTMFRSIFQILHRINEMIAKNRGSTWNAEQWCRENAGR